LTVQPIKIARRDTANHKNGFMVPWEANIPIVMRGNSEGNGRRDASISIMRNISKYPMFWMRE
jgi:hypothetical protein